MHVHKIMKNENGMRVSQDLSWIKYCLGYGTVCFEASPVKWWCLADGCVCVGGGSLSRLLLPFCCLSGKVIIERRQAVGPPSQLSVIYLSNQPRRFCGLDFRWNIIIYLKFKSIRDGPRFKYFFKMLSSLLFFLLPRLVVTICGSCFL